jgi:hypothetical protein
MRIYVGGVAVTAAAIRDDLVRNLPRLHRKVAANIADCAAAALASRSVNSSEWIAVLPRQSQEKSKERYISAVLQSPLLNIQQVMTRYVKDVVERQTQKGQTIVLMMDQTQITPDRQCFMITIRCNGRALPLLWRVVETEGAIGFDVQEPLLNAVKEMIPPNCNVLLLADRFYGTKRLVDCCQKAGWGYIIRLRGNLIFQHDGGEISAIEVGILPGGVAIGAKFQNSEIKTNIGFLQEKGHSEPWILSMSMTPTKGRILDYSMRWGCECAFSDLKTRGFDVTRTHLRAPRRIENLILILTR